MQMISGRNKERIRLEESTNLEGGCGQFAWEFQAPVWI
jgi:hypothetical protein